MFFGCNATYSAGLLPKHIDCALALRSRLFVFYHSLLYILAQGALMTHCSCYLCCMLLLLLCLNGILCVWSLTNILCISLEWLH